MLISIIIPTYKRSSNITKAIDSIYDSKIDEDLYTIEVIVVDDNGRGNKYQIDTEELLRNYIDSKQIKYIINEENCGGGEARNRGVAACCGQIIGFLDDDDLFIKGKIEKHIQDIEAGYDISLTSMKVIDEHGTELYPPWAVAKGSTLEDFIVCGNAYTPMIMVKREIFMLSGGFDKVKMLQDHILMLKLLKVTNKITSSEEKFFIHNVHSGERVSRNLSFESLSVKQSYEKSFLGNLSNVQRNQLLLKQNKEKSLFTYRLQGWGDSIFIAFKGIKYISTSEQLLYFCKYFTRILLGDKMYILLDKLRRK